MIASRGVFTGIAILLPGQGLETKRQLPEHEADFEALYLARSFFL
jgi:hypothetical protein